jgi:hypothetical protein
MKDVDTSVRVVRGIARKGERPWPRRGIGHAGPIGASRIRPDCGECSDRNSAPPFKNEPREFLIGRGPVGGRDASHTDRSDRVPRLFYLPTTIIMSGRKPMQQTGDSAARKAKLAELERERERLLEEEKCAEEVEAREWEAAATREREAAAERERVRQQRCARAEAELEAWWSASPETSRSGAGASSSRCVVLSTSKFEDTWGSDY